MQAAEYWSAKAKSGYAPNWFSLCSDEITRRCTGQTEVGVTAWHLRRLFNGPVDTLMEIGCLSGRKALACKGLFAREVYGVDCAEGAIEAGRAEFKDAIDLRVMDLNAPEPMGRKFNIILSNGVLHHLANLEATADWMADHLLRNGVIIASEFTGPVRYRYTDYEVRLINTGVAMLPKALRQTFDPISLQPKLDADPSESVRSRDIADVLRASGFDIEMIPYGGNVLQRALGPQFFKWFDAQSSEHCEALAALVTFDEEVMRREPSHHHVMIARHRK